MLCLGQKAIWQGSIFDRGQSIAFSELSRLRPLRRMSSFSSLAADALLETGLSPRRLMTWISIRPARFLPNTRPAAHSGWNGRQAADGRWGGAGRERPRPRSLIGHGQTLSDIQEPQARRSTWAGVLNSTDLPMDAVHLMTSIVSYS